MSSSKYDVAMGQPSWFQMVTISSPEISSALLPVASKSDKLPLETELVALDNIQIKHLL